MFYSILADILATAHFAWVAVVVFGLVFVLVGRLAGWACVGNRWFRGIHMAMISLVVARCLVWDVCPLTTWEENCREIALTQDWRGSSFGLLMHDLIHPDAPNVPMWVYHVAYTGFGLLVLSAFWVAPVNWRPNRPEDIALEGHPSPQT